MEFLCNQAALWERLQVGEKKKFRRPDFSSPLLNAPIRQCNSFLNTQPVLAFCRSTSRVFVDVVCDLEARRGRSFYHGAIRAARASLRPAKPHCLSGVRGIRHTLVMIGFLF
jgi:hypothetical protein